MIYEYFQRRDRLHTSESDDFRREILTSKVDPRTAMERQVASIIRVYTFQESNYGSLTLHIRITVSKVYCYQSYIDETTAHTMKLGYLG